MKKKSLLMLGLCMVLTLVGTAMASPPPKPACGTNSALGVTALSPSSYSYVQASAGSQVVSFTVSSPSLNINQGCDANLPYVYGNGNSGDDIEVTVSVGTVTNFDGSPLTLTAAELTALKGAFSFSPASFILADPGTGSQGVTLTFTNTSVVPVGKYDVVIDVKPETGVGVGDTTKTFTVEVTAPQLVILDTRAPDVTITSPTGNFLLNDSVHVQFTAVDPPENGAGTGVHAIRASITGCGDVFNQDISGNLSISPSLPVAADVTVTAQEDITAVWIGVLTLNAEADDAATPAIHTGSDTSTLTVGVGVTALPPISVAGRQFKAGSTVPIKWKVTGSGGALLPPFADITATVTTPTGGIINYVAGEGADSIRWELDETGNALQYIANYQIPSTGVGIYTVKIYVNDVCGNPAKQGEFTFYASTKGGK